MIIEILVITLIVLILLIIAIWYLAYLVDMEMTWVYTRTGHKYRILEECLMKCPMTGEWYHAVTYLGLRDGKVYVRERNSFYSKFVKVRDYENGNNSKQGVSEAH